MVLPLKPKVIFNLSDLQGLDYLEDIPERLVEWIEMQFITGADRITVYTYYVPRKMQQVLNYYSKKGSVTVVPCFIQMLLR